MSWSCGPVVEQAAQALAVGRARTVVERSPTTLRGVAQDPLARGALVGDHAVGADDRDQVGGVAHERGEAGLALAAVHLLGQGVALEGQRDLRGERRERGDDQRRERRRSPTTSRPRHSPRTASGDERARAVRAARARRAPPAAAAASGAAQAAEPSSRRGVRASGRGGASASRPTHGEALAVAARTDAPRRRARASSGSARARRRRSRRVVVAATSAAPARCRTCSRAADRSCCLTRPGHAHDHQQEQRRPRRR